MGLCMQEFGCRCAILKYSKLQVPKLPQLLSFRQLLREQYSRDLSLSLESAWLAALEAIHEGLCPSTL